MSVIAQILVLLSVVFFLLAVFFLFKWIHTLLKLKSTEKEHELLMAEFQKLKGEQEIGLAKSREIQEALLLKNEELRKQDQRRLEGLLQPFAESLRHFQGRIEEGQKEQKADQAGLRTEVQKLYELNKILSEDAENLVKALKGENQVQGAWGEMVLERCLEQSGLRKDAEFLTQASFEHAGGRLRPDVVLCLPENRRLVIDSKVSLKSYQAAFEKEAGSAESEVREFLKSLQRHIKDLESKNYAALFPEQALDFVLLFIPIDGAYFLAIKEDPELYEKSLARGIVLTSPSTLLPLLRLMANLWKTAHQNENALEIARQGEMLFEKLSKVVDGFNRVEDHFGKAQMEFQKALKLLYIGRGNLLDRAKKLQELGIKSEQKSPQWKSVEEGKENGL